MPALTLTVFILTYVGMAIGRVPGMRLDRTGIALVAVAVLLGAGAIDTAFVGHAADAPTLLLLFALMVVSAQIEHSGFYAACARRIVAARIGARGLLALTIAVAGGISAVLVNDIVVFAMTPLLATGLGGRGLDPRPFLLGLAAASNAGSAAMVIGNPQNILIAQVGHLDFWSFFAVCAVPAIVALGVAYVVIARQWREELVTVRSVTVRVGTNEVLDRQQIAKGVVATLAVIVWFSLSLPREVGAIAVAALLLASRKVASRTILSAIDWQLLVLFACLFVVTAAVAQSGAGDALLDWLAQRDLWPDRLAVLLPLALVLSNTIGNVPTVVLIATFWTDAAPGALIALALLSTLAGNLLIVGSIASLIVAERAATVGVILGFRDFVRAGVPITLVTMVFAALWLVATGQIGF